MRVMSLAVGILCGLALMISPAQAQQPAVPVPLGQSERVRDKWLLTVVSVTPNATAQVLAENRFNDPPEPGKQFFIATVSVTNVGDEPEGFAASYLLRAVGPSAVEYSTFRDSCGVIPNELSSKTLFPGGTTSGNVCWQVLSSDVDRLLMYPEPPYGRGYQFFALSSGNGLPASSSRPTWVRGYPSEGNPAFGMTAGCVYYVAQWSDGSYTSVPWDCDPGVVVVSPDGTRFANRGYPQRAANGCIEYVTQWNDGSYTWVPFDCPPGVVYGKP